MKTIYRRLCVLGMLTPVLSVNAQMELDKANFKYTKEDILTKTQHYRLELEAAQIGYQGRHVSVGSGIRLLAYHLVGDFSLEGGFVQRWMARIPYQQHKIGFTQFENMKPFTGREFNLAMSYSIYKSYENKSELISVKHENTHRIADLPVRIYKVIDIKVGMLYYDLPGQIVFENTANFNRPVIHFMQNTRAITLGISKKKLQHDVFSTDLYGIVKQSAFGELFVDFLYGLGESFPDVLYRANYASANDPEPSFYNPISANTMQTIRNGMKYNPFGGLLGYRSGGMRHGFGATVMFGFRPGYISQQDIGFLDNLTGSFTMAYHFPIRKK